MLQAWQDGLAADPSAEEAASALMRLYMAQGRRPLAIEVYERCRGALSSLGLATSPELEELRTRVDGSTQPAARRTSLAADRGAGPPEEERRLVTALFVELLPVGLGAQADPEDLPRSDRRPPRPRHQRSGGAGGSDRVYLRADHVCVFWRSADIRGRPRTRPAVRTSHSGGYRPGAAR